MKIDVTIIVSAVSLLLALLAWRRNAKVDDKKDAGQMTEIIVKLEIMKDDIKEIKLDLKEVKGDIENIKERLLIVEQSAKSAHKRIDEIAKKNIEKENECA